MRLTRLEQFKQEADILMQSSEWLCETIDKFIYLEEYYQENPCLDTPDHMEQRLARLDELQLRAEWEDRQQQELLKKYSDVIGQIST